MTAIEPLPDVDAPQVLLYVSLSLADRNREREAAWLDAYAEASRYCDGVILITPSWQETPNALKHDLVRKTIDTCHTHDLEIYWGRYLWLRDRCDAYTQTMGDLYDSAYYVAYLTRLADEAKWIDATGTVAYCEPHSTVLASLKANGLTSAQRARIIEAISAARMLAPPATLAYPAGGQNFDKYSWALRYLGEQFLHSKTYCLRDPAQLNATPPPGHEIQLDWWGVWLGERDRDDDKNPLSIDELRDLDWDDIRVAHPECLGVWLYADAVERQDIMYRLGDSDMAPTTPSDTDATPVTKAGN